MSYQVIARKYRPQTFADLTGQDYVARTLGNALDQQRLHHAYIFSGVRGTGKTTTARILAKGLNCLTGVTSHPCLKCDSCLEIAAGISIDVHEIDAASHTGVDNVRDVIISSIAIGPARDRYKVFVIDEVHQLSAHAFNALLKTLEEPPAHVRFIMATTALHKVPDTILSRCQHFEFRPISTEKIFQRLRLIAEQEGIRIADGALREIARAGAGSLRDAQSAFDQVIAFSGSEIREEDVYTALGLISTNVLERTTHAIATRDAKTILDDIEQIAARGYDFGSFARELMSWLRHLLVIKSGIESAEVLGVTDLDVARLKPLADGFSEEDLVRSFHLLAAVEKEIKDSSFPRFALEMGLLKMVHMLQLRPLGEVINRLEALEKRLRESGGLQSSAPPGNARQAATTKPPGTLAKGIEGKASARTSPPATAVKPPERAARPQDILEEPPDFDDYSTPSEVDLVPPAEVRKSSVPRSPEIEAISAELERLNRTWLLTAFDEARDLTYQDGTLTMTFGKEDIFASRSRDSQALFRDLGERLFNQAIKLEVRVDGPQVEKVDQEKQARESLRQRALQSPAVKMFIEKFQGEIVEVRERPAGGRGQGSGTRDTDP